MEESADGMRWTAGQHVLLTRIGENAQPRGGKGKDRRDALSPHKKLDSLGVLQMKKIVQRLLQQRLWGAKTLLSRPDTQKIWREIEDETRDRESQLQRDPSALRWLWG